ncbi:hypothetical protein ETAE_1501 [Edwardsiella piscicida]|uniref:Uncharacterized protein n=1 Tax=Edwardsiella piscicida TaxID=1263550 RepID=A0AAU8PH21_EDWPI|nr:hypothetical protein ETAE_1501 [Edwardsiella tarda EIB202]
MWFNIGTLALTTSKNVIYCAIPRSFLKIRFLLIYGGYWLL